MHGKHPFLSLLRPAGLSLLLAACGGGQTVEAPPPPPPVQPGLHVYKDPVTGAFVDHPVADPQEAATGVSATGIRVLPQARQASVQAAEPPREYEAPVEGGGVMVDLPAPYSGAGN